jgi:hypothetical protein
VVRIEVDYVLAGSEHVWDFQIRNLKINLGHVPSDTFLSCSDLLKHLPDMFSPTLSLQVLNCSWTRFSLTTMKHYIAEL